VIAARFALPLVVAAGVIAMPASASARPHHHHHCKDRSTTLGRRVCSKFGAWSTVTQLPPITPDLTLGMRTLPLPTESSGAAARSVTGGTATEMVTAPGAGLRWSVGVGAGLYLGLGIEGGPIGLGEQARPDGSGPVGFYAMGLVHGGVRRRFGRWTLASELATGAAIVPVSYPVGSAETTSTDANLRSVIEARARADLWLNPWITVGAFAGADLGGRGTMSGLQLSLHIRAFDAGR
jgi:hypothetical protein